MHFPSETDLEEWFDEWYDEQPRLDSTFPDSMDAEELPPPVATGQQFSLKAILLFVFVIALSLAMIRWAESIISAYKFGIVLSGTVLLAVAMGAAIGYAMGIWLANIRR